MKLRLFSVLSGTVLLLSACHSELSTKSRGPIVLGDSATIVMESDESRLKDGVADFHSAGNDDEDDSTTSPAGGDTTVTSRPSSQTAVGGLVAAFKEVTLNIPGLSTRGTSNTDLQNARGASYTLTGGTLAGNSLHTSGGTVSKVTQRYTTLIAIQDGAEKLTLDDLSFTSGWNTIDGNGGNYSLAGLDPAKLEYEKARPAEIRSAVQAAARKKRMSRQDTQDWLDAVKNVRAANQAPCIVILKSVSWRITGKDAAGKGFNKELRIDIP